MVIYMMETFVKLLQSAKSRLANITSHQPVHLVLGNESCDLDSTISALSLAYFLYSYKYLNSEVCVIPVMNVESQYFALRTETNFLLNKYGISPDHLVFRDNIQQHYPDLIKHKLRTSLVDHHVLSNHDKILENTVVEIYDHRTINQEEICKSDKTIIKTVGSCATLVTLDILKTKPEIIFTQLANLLYGTIVYDTIGLNREMGRTFDEDLEAAQLLETIINPSQTRKELFEVLWKVHNDTSTLTTKDLLYRDLKIVKNVLIPGLPMLVEDYLKRDDASLSLQQFCDENQIDNIVLVGIDASRQQVRRDVAVYSPDTKNRNLLCQHLQNPELSLSEIATNHQNLVCFRQGNIKLTRKFIIPLINNYNV